MLQMNRSREDRRLPARSLVTDLPLYYLSVLLEGLVGLLLVFGVWGELLSLLALEQRQALISTQDTVMYSIVFLVIAAGLAALWRTAETMRRRAREQADAVNEAVAAASKSDSSAGNGNA